jgi:hypothetical protein
MNSTKYYYILFHVWHSPGVKARTLKICVAQNFVPVTAPPPQLGSNTTPSLSLRVPVDAFARPVASLSAIFSRSLRLYCLPVLLSFQQMLASFFFFYIFFKRAVNKPNCKAG